MRTRKRRSVVRQCQRHRLFLLPALDVRLELGAELLDRILDRPAGAVGQAADGRAGDDADAVADVGEDVEVLAAALAGSQALDDLQHPAGALATRRTLPARLV